MVPILRLGSAIVCAALFIPGAIGADDDPAPVPLDQIEKSIRVPDGFEAKLFAGEPKVVQPIAMTTDARGRLWVVECLSYPKWKPSGEGEDRVSIFEDRDGDGRFDQKKVFWDKGRNLTGIAFGFGGVWLCSLPELIFVPDRDSNDQPDAAPEVLLDGWDLKAQHNAFNGLAWGPDGWLYGCNGILSRSNIGVPGTPDDQRLKMNCGVWRYHPKRKVVEAMAHGTTNPWGIAFDDRGEMFIANCVIKHLFHIVPGGRYERMFGQDNNPYAFELIPSIADHLHWAGGFWKTEGAEHPRNDVTGGGHAHSGAFIYTGAAWPAKYRNSFFTINIHGHRVNNDQLVPQGSGFIGRHELDFARVNDSWFRGVALAASHDGNLYVSDWSDAGECHDYEDIHRENGRIFKISFKGKTNAPRNLASLGDGELVKLLESSEGWESTKARMLLQERAAANRLSNGVKDSLGKMAGSAADSGARLRALWTLHAIGSLDSNLWLQLLNARDEYLRGWTVQLALDHDQAPSSQLLARFNELASKDSSPIVRRFLASALQRLDFQTRLPLARALLTRAEDAADTNLPLLIWYGIEPIVSTDDLAAIQLLEQGRIPKVRQFIAQRLSLRLAMNGLSELLLKTKDPAIQQDIIFGMHTALNGRRNLQPPSRWADAAALLKSHTNKSVSQYATELSLIFGEEKAIAEMTNQALDLGEKSGARQNALQALIQARAPNTVELLHRLLPDQAVRLIAIRGLAAFDHPETPKLLIEKYASLPPDEKSEVINSLASRSGYAVALLEAVRSNRIPARDITPFPARQMQAYKDERINNLLKEIGTVRAVSGEKAALIEKYKQLFQPGVLEKADLRHGRAIFNRACSACHKLFDEGGDLAPELTGSQRSNLDYLLVNIVDPNALVWDRYKAVYFETADDRLISGVVQSENESTVMIHTQTGLVTVPRAELVNRTQSQLSIMPEGLLDALQGNEVIDLIAYLQSPEQVPLPDPAVDSGSSNNTSTKRSSLKTLYENDFQASALGTVPDDFIVIAGDFFVKGEGSSKYLELPGAPLDSYSLVFGAGEKENVGVSARFFSTSKGRRYPTFAVGLNGVGGYKLRVSPGKKQLELYRGDLVKASAPYDWESGKWVTLSLELTRAGDKWLIQGKAWKEGESTPSQPIITFEDSETPPSGKQSIGGSPFSGTPIRFDDLKVWKIES